MCLQLAGSSTSVGDWVLMIVSWQMADLKENIEDEIHSAHDQYLKMDSHVELYMNEIEHLM